MKSGVDMPKPYHSTIPDKIIMEMRNATEKALAHN